MTEQWLPFLLGVLITVFAVLVISSMFRSSSRQERAKRFGESASSAPVARRRSASAATQAADAKDYGEAVSGRGGGFEAYTLRVGAAHCLTARDMRSRRFLAADLPDLPLRGCDQACRCKFEAVADRRGRVERRAASFPSDELGDDVRAADRRSYHDRRNRKA